MVKRLSFVLVASCLAVVNAQAQPQMPPSFDVVSVKLSTQPYLAVSPQRSGGRVSWTTDLMYIVGYAYHAQPWRISGPVPGSEHIYAINVTTSPDATEEQIRLMFRSLLADRFKMASHFITKATEGYALTLGANRLKVTAVSESDKIAPLPEWFQAASPTDLEGKVVTTLEKAGVATLTGRRASMERLTEVLQRMLSKPVLDQTSLTGNYYFAFRYAPDSAPVDSDAPSLSAAIQQNLGLKLVKHTGPMEMLVVDSIQVVPTEN